MKITDKKAKEQEQAKEQEKATEQRAGQGTLLYELRGIGWNMKKIATSTEKMSENLMFTNQLLKSIANELIKRE